MMESINKTPLRLSRLMKNNGVLVQIRKLCKGGLQISRTDLENKYSVLTF